MPKCQNRQNVSPWTHQKTENTTDTCRLWFSLTHSVKVLVYNES